MHLQQRKAGNTYAIATASDDVVPPLSSAPGAHPSWRDNELRNILERIEETIWSITKSCKSCQVNKRRQLKYGHLPSKIVISVPWESLCVDLIGPYTLKGKDGSAVDFMALTMIHPASSWLELVELPLVSRLTTILVNGKEKVSKELIFDKSSNQIARLVNKIWLCRYLRCCHLMYDNRSEFKLHFESLCESHGIKCKPTTIRNPQANTICERLHQVLGTMMRTSEVDMAKSVEPADIDTFINNAAWAIRSTYHIQY